ncbi:hypothetical protein EMPS_10007 [Entomortierella parvispora]|uniref:N-acetyltransferase domain-containing protein n=1 Tax=Entomortierella parvispora TaxID=205924 RepID=A0A9P3M0V3_9FUNG|nr:hypothetical protein EMPS_10007 [Entomortierella parvispora]
MSSAYGSIARPISDKSLGSILPRHAKLRAVTDQDSSSAVNDATLFKIISQPLKQDSKKQDESVYILDAAAHSTLLEAMGTVFNNEVDRGDTYPQEHRLDTAQFDNYFFSGDAFVLLKGHYSHATDVLPKGSASEWDDDLLGFFYIKPNFPGRCSHICNGGFMVNPAHRGLGLGSIMGKAFLRIVPVIGYKASMFNLVFVSNVASIKLWRRLGFKEIGRIPKAGRLRGQGADHSQDNSDNEGYVDAIQFYWDFETMPVTED